MTTVLTITEKRDFLLQLSEDKFRREVLVPLLTRLGFHDPILHHHAGEKGKDIVCKELDEKLGKTRYLAVVAKSGDVTGSASGSNGYFTVINQVKQALNEPYKHVYELREVVIDQVIIAISGHFLPTALDSVYGTLKAERLDKAIRDTLDAGKLVQLIDKSFPEFWDESTDEKASLVRQRNTLLNNLGKLLKVLLSNRLERDNALRRLAAEELDIELLPGRDFARYMADVGYRAITIEEIDPAFVAPFLNTDHESIKKAVFRLKKCVQKALMEVDEQIEPLRKILQETNPKEILGYLQDVKYYTNRDGKMAVDVSDVVDDYDFKEAVQQYEQRRDLLLQTRQSDLYTNLMTDMHAKVAPALMQFWEKHSREDRNWWLGYAVQFSFPDKRIIASSSYEREEEPIILRDGTFKERQTSRTSVDSDNRLQIEYAVNWYGILHEEKLSLEDRVSDFIWHYEKALADAYFGLLERERERATDGPHSASDHPAP